MPGSQDRAGSNMTFSLEARHLKGTCDIFPERAKYILTESVSDKLSNDKLNSFQSNLIKTNQCWLILIESN